MGRFYFHLQADDQIVPDDEGVDLPDLSAAQHEAILAARELLAEAFKSGGAKVPEAFVIIFEGRRSSGQNASIHASDHLHHAANGAWFSECRFNIERND
jgi:uncharacterized protein DUF6894